MEKSVVCAFNNKGGKIYHQDIFTLFDCGSVIITIGNNINVITIKDTEKYYEYHNNDFIEDGSGKWIESDEYITFTVYRLTRKDISYFEFEFNYDKEFVKITSDGDLFNTDGLLYSP